MIRNKNTCFFILPVLLVVIFAPCATAGIVGKTYYAFLIDTNGMAFQNLTITFGEADSDNESSADNATEGNLHITVQATSLDNETGAYTVEGILFRGTWQAAKQEYSSFYQAYVYTYYSFLIYGIAFYRGAYIAGVIYSDTLIKCTAKDTEEIVSVLPFIGIAVPTPS
ncbi:MAG: hypothetical protein N3B18_06260 [Desulfobacterota bacterium]|nr:hypothetical protein [Thermodesulfobacteriota bacterium]